ncbi:MAG: GWxTD domain-containing protein [Acidobacteriota bacterium]
MSHRRRSRALSILALLIASPLASGKDIPLPEKPMKEKELPPRYQKWLDEDVLYIITDRERDVFLRLRTDELRELFIQDFWSRRDPVPSTPENEYKIEHEKRVAYCREYYKVLRQDRSCVYITMGPPAKVNPYVNSSDWWPMEVWEYENTGIPDLPTRFTLLFFKPGVAGFFRLWSPTVDGVKSLRTVSPASPAMDQKNFNPGRYLPNIIAEAIRGLAPGIGPFASERILAEVQKPPRVDLTGVERILTGSVETALSYGILPMKAMAKWYYGSDALRREVNVAIEIPPSEVSFRAYKGKKFFGFFVAGQVREAGPKATGPIVAEWSGNVDVSLSDEEAEKTAGFPFLYSYRLRLLPGSYTLNLVARDDSSQKLGIVDIPIAIPEAAGSPTLSDVVFAHKLSRLADASGNIYAPFVFDDQVEMVPNVDQALSSQSPATLFVQIHHVEKESDAMKLRYRIESSGKTVKDEAEALAVGRQNALGVQSVLKQLSLRDVPAGSYDVLVDLETAPPSGSPAKIASARTKVTISPSPSQPGRLLARSFENADPARAANSAGMQLLARGKVQDAKEQFRLALGYEPDMTAAKVNLARAMVVSGDYDGARNAIVELPSTAVDSQALMVLGLAYAGLGDPAEAARNYEKAIASGGETPEALNALAEALAGSGDKEGAKAKARRSLEIQPDQPLVKKFLAGLD